MTIYELKERMETIENPKVFVVFDLLYKGINYTNETKIPIHCGNPDHPVYWKTLKHVVANESCCDICYKINSSNNRKNQSVDRFRSRSEQFDIILKKCEETGYIVIDCKDFLDKKSKKFILKCPKCGDKWLTTFKSFVQHSNNHSCNLLSIWWFSANADTFITDYGLLPVIPSEHNKPYIKSSFKMGWKCVRCGRLMFASLKDIKLKGYSCKCNQYGH